MADNTGPLKGIRILDLSRVLAGPSCTQLLADLGADVIKLERPGVGDETRTWGPPFVKDADGEDTSESGYYLSANRNKRSVAIDMSRPEGAELVKGLLGHSDVLVENFKVGGLAKYGLGYDDLKEAFPELIYCSITGYGQTGPYAERPGYDMMAQGIGGLISMTGEPGRPPVKVPIAINDVMTGMYAAVGILAALRHRDETDSGSPGGQHIDLSLLDVQVGWLFNQGLNYLTGGVVPERLGTAHPNTVPYQAFETADGFIILAANNDEQFKRFLKLAGREELNDDPRFFPNSERIRNRDVVIETVGGIIKEKPSAYWIEELANDNVSCCPINTMDQVFEDPQVQARGMQIEMPFDAAGRGAVDLIGSPLKMSETPVSYRQSPPLLGQHTDEVLEELLGLDKDALDKLRADKLI
ncbi:MAG: CoA transferase [Rhodospirillales bacterium]|nr:CoA transferase [Rhodospirillales bacterium]